MFEKVYTQNELQRINDARTAIPGHRYIDTWGNIYEGTPYRRINSLAGTSAVWGGITGDISDQTDLWLVLESKVESVTGLNTDNTDPSNPIIQISVDGITITGDGTPGNPLTVDFSGILTDTLTDGKILVGDVTNEAAEVTPSGDLTMNNAGVFTLNDEFQLAMISQFRFLTKN